MSSHDFLDHLKSFFCVIISCNAGAGKTTAHNMVVLLNLVINPLWFSVSQPKPTYLKCHITGLKLQVFEES